MYFALVIIGLCSSAMGKNSPQCLPWISIERKIKDHLPEGNCTLNEDCSGISCEFQRFDARIESSMSLNACDNPSSLELAVNIPKLNVNHWRRRFYHEDSFYLTDHFGGIFKFKKSKEKFVVGLSFKVEAEKSVASPLFHLFPALVPQREFSLFENVEFPISYCSAKTESLSSSPVKTTPGAVRFSTTAPSHHYLINGILLQSRNCNITHSTCPIHEMCQQTAVSSTNGTCICSPDYARNQEGKCVYNPTTTTSDPQPDHSPAPSAPSNKSLLLTAILVPITVILVLVGLVYITIRFRVWQHLRRRLRVQVYEHVRLGQDDDDDVEDESSNPVA